MFSFNLLLDPLLFLEPLGGVILFRAFMFDLEQETSKVSAHDLFGDSTLHIILQNSVMSCLCSSHFMACSDSHMFCLVTILHKLFIPKFNIPVS